MATFLVSKTLNVKNLIYFWRFYSKLLSNQLWDRGGCRGAHPFFAKYLWNWQWSFGKILEIDHEFYMTCWPVTWILAKYVWEYNRQNGICRDDKYYKPDKYSIMKSVMTLNHGIHWRNFVSGKSLSCIEIAMSLRSLFLVMLNAYMFVFLPTHSRQQGNLKLDQVRGD
jgi:hypothetical protein